MMILMFLGLAFGYSRLETDFDLPANLIMRGEEKRIRQVLLNLLSNAMKFTPEGGKISVSARYANPGTVALSVADTGIGIAADKIDQAFMPFVQVSDAEVRKEKQGSGLGLALCRSLVELHGGTIEIESTVNVGTVARVLLPATRFHGEGVVADPDD